VQSIHFADQLYTEVLKVAAENPISRLLVLQRFLLDHRPPQKSDEWLMKWARLLREICYDSNEEEMSEAVFRALRGERPYRSLVG
jgi:hypothetical protein